MCTSLAQAGPRGRSGGGGGGGQKNESKDHSRDTCSLGRSLPVASCVLCASPQMAGLQNFSYEPQKSPSEGETRRQMRAHSSALLVQLALTTAGWHLRNEQKYCTRRGALVKLMKRPLFARPSRAAAKCSMRRRRARLSCIAMSGAAESGSRVQVE